MKKSLLLVGAAFAAAILMSGCAGISTNNGGIGAGPSFMNFYSEVSGNSILQPIAGNSYTVVKRDVQASGKLMCYFSVVNLGDVSFETLKNEALKNIDGAHDLIDVKMDYKMKNILGINEITVTVTGTAIKFNK